MQLNFACCAASFRTHNPTSSIQIEEVGLSDELVYCFYWFSTLTEVEQDSQALSLGDSTFDILWVEVYEFQFRHTVL